MLGGFRVIVGSHVATRFQNQKTGALLAYLAFYSQRAHPREVLVDLLWPAAEARMRLASMLGGSGDPDAGIVHGRAAVEADPLREEAHAVLMRLYASAGRPQEALRQYRELDRILWDELGEQPSAALQALDA